MPIIVNRALLLIGAITFLSCGVNTHAIRNDIFLGKKKLPEIERVHFSYKYPRGIMSGGTVFCRANRVQEFFDKSDFFIRNKSEKRNIYLGNYPFSKVRFEIREFSLRESANDVAVTNKHGENVGMYPEHTAEFLIEGVLTIGKKKYLIKEVNCIVSSPHRSLFIPFLVVHRPYRIKEKVVMENLINRFVKKLYKEIKKRKKS